MPFPGVSFDFFNDFEQCVNNTTPTATQLANSSHSAGGTWDITNDGGLITAQTTSQSPLSAIGDAGTLGCQYSSSTGAHGWEHWSLPAAVTKISAGFAYKTGNFPLPQYNGGEMCHAFVFSQAAFGPMWRISDESSSADNHRQIRLSPASAGVSISVNDSTWYWITMQLTIGGTVFLSIYNITGGKVGSLVGSTNTPDNLGATSCNEILFGNQVQSSLSLAVTTSLDNILLDTTNALFPLLPVTEGEMMAARQVGTLGPLPEKIEVVSY